MREAVARTWFRTKVDQLEKITEIEAHMPSDTTRNWLLTISFWPATIAVYHRFNAWIGRLLTRYCCNGRNRKRLRLPCAWPACECPAAIEACLEPPDFDEPAPSQPTTPMGTRAVPRRTRIGIGVGTELTDAVSSSPLSPTGSPRPSVDYG